MWLYMIDELFFLQLFTYHFLLFATIHQGKLLPDKSDLPSTKPVPKMRNKSSTTRPRPKTIHVDSSAVDLQEGVLSPSRSKKGSTSNLTGKKGCA